LALALGQAGDQRTILIIQVDGECCQVGQLVGLAAGLGDSGHVRLIQQPLEGDLGRQYPVPGGNVLNSGNIRHLVARQRRIGGQCQIVLADVVEQCVLPEQHVVLDLNGRQRRAQFFDDCAQQGQWEIRHADSARQPLLLE